MRDTDSPLGQLLKIDTIAVGAWNAVGVVAIGGINATGVFTIGGR